MDIEIKVKSNPKYKIIIFRNKSNDIGFQLVKDTIIDRILNFGGYKYLDTKWIEEYEGIEDCGKKLLEEIYKSLEDYKVVANIKSNSNQYLLAVVDEIKNYI